MGKKILIVSLVMVLGAALLGASILAAHELTGRDVVSDGTAATLEGTLRYEAAEWYLDTDDGSFLLHLGNRDYLESSGVNLEEGAVIEADGFRTGSDVAVVSIRKDGKTFIFRDPDGTPKWAGRGERYARDGLRSGGECAGCEDDIRRGGGLDGRRMGCGPKEDLRQGYGTRGNGGRLQGSN